MSLKTPIYLDYHSTTPVDPQVLEAMLPYFTESFGNAASKDHSFGHSAAEAVERARARVAEAIGAREDEIIFTSGATEANNLALFGIAEAYADKGDHIITCVTEHRAVLDAAERLEKGGRKVTYLPVDKYGRVDPDDLCAAITERTVLVSIMAANNEIGTLAPLEEIGRITRAHRVFFHTDAAQAVGHVPIDVERLNIDLLSMSAHKFYGPKGIGCLYVRSRSPRVSLEPIIFGGGHEHGVRSGTLNVPGVVGMAAALDLCVANLDQEEARLNALRVRLLEALSKAVDQLDRYGDPERSLARNLNIGFRGVRAKSLVVTLPELAFSTGSACTTAKAKPSHVLKALGLSDDRVREAIRIGVGRYTTESEIDFAAERLITTVGRLRSY